MLTKSQNTGLLKNRGYDGRDPVLDSYSSDSDYPPAFWLSYEPPDVDW
jgi:hypothetical protein